MTKVSYCLPSTQSIVNENFFTSSRDYEHLLVPLSRDLASLNKLHNFGAKLSWLVFLNYVTTVSDDMHFILALHVSYRKLGVLAFSSSQKEHLFRLETKEC